MDKIVECLKDKSVLVTGFTGFLAKIFVEKVLRIQPDVRRIYLIVRATDLSSAKQRVQDQVRKDLFRVLREKHGSGFETFLWSKVCPVAGDISSSSFGITDASIMEELKREVDFVVNVAATTNFDERYDLALDVNTMGAQHALEFARECPKLEMLMHVSTAYVAGTKSGLIPERPFKMGETLSDTTPILDIQEEIQLAKEKLAELQDDAVKDTDRIMKQFGLKRAKHFGWPNTYVFTKAMGEMLLGEAKGMPIVIIRPTVIESTYSDPFPGWMEGTRTVDSLLVSYCKGKLTSFLANAEFVLDVIPGDMVVNAMILSIAAHSKQPSQFIYHIGSSVQNPLKYSKMIDCAYRYFRANPCYGKDGKPIMVTKISVFPNMDSFRRYMLLFHKMPLEGLNFANQAFCQMFNQLHRDLRRKYNFVMYLAELYEPYVFFQGRFDDKNSEELRSEVKAGGAEDKLFNFDPKSINWEDYIMKIHIPGIIKYVLR